MNEVYYTPQNPLHDPSEWFTAQVDYLSKSVKNGIATRKELIDNRDPEHPIRTFNDKVQDIAIKCFLILFGLPFYTMGVMATHAVRCITLIGTNLVKCELSEIFLSLIQEVWAIAKAPIYAIAIEFYAIAGIVFPLTLRSVIAQLECDWSGSERYYDVRRAKNSEEADARLADYFTNRNSKTTFFLAFCFQPMGELNNPDRVDRYGIINP